MPFFSSAERGSVAPKPRMPPTPRPPPAFTCAEPGPWQFSHSNLPFWTPPILPISVFLNSAINGAWHFSQAWEPMIWASTGALERLPLEALGRRSGGLFFALAGQQVHQGFGFGQFRLVLDRFRLRRPGALSKSPQRRKGLVVELAVRTLRYLGPSPDLLGVGRQVGKCRIVGGLRAWLAGFLRLGRLRPGRQGRIDARDSKAAIGFGRLSQAKCGAIE